MEPHHLTDCLLPDSQESQASQEEKCGGFGGRSGV